MANRVYRHLLYHELRIFPVGLEESVLTEIGMFLHLRFEVVDGFLYLVENAPLEGDDFIRLSWLVPLKYVLYQAKFDICER